MFVKRLEHSKAVLCVKRNRENVLERKNLGKFQIYQGPMRKMGLEPTRLYRHKILSLACLPIPALPQLLSAYHKHGIYFSTSQNVCKVHFQKKSKFIKSWGSERVLQFFYIKQGCPRACLNIFYHLVTWTALFHELQRKRFFYFSCCAWAIFSARTFKGSPNSVMNPSAS